LNCHSRIP